MRLSSMLRNKSRPESLDTTASCDIHIDITEEFISVNGMKFSIPCHKDELKSIFGEWMFSMDNITGTSLRYIYIWHEIGIVAYSKDDENVNCVLIQFYPSEKKKAINLPKKVFGGSVTVNGESWITLFKEEKYLRIERIRMPLKLVHYGNFTLCMSGDTKHKKSIKSLGINQKTTLGLGGK